MVLKAGEKIHVMFRRKFDGDLRRHFAGEVTEASEQAARVDGYIFILHVMDNRYVRIQGLRTRIISLTDAGNIINVLPRNANIEKTAYTMSKEKHLVVTDGETFVLDVNEFGAGR
jgi:hypothetical protein